MRCLPSLQHHDAWKMPTTKFVCPKMKQERDKVTKNPIVSVTVTILGLFEDATELLLHVC